MRVDSGRAARNGGWVHRLKDEPLPIRRPIRPIVQARPILPNLDTMLARWAAETHQEARHGLSKALGVSEAALSDLGATFAAQHVAWAFPMRDGAGRVVGIRLRADDGRKWAVRGSREGLFYRESVPHDHVAVVSEGPTDTAAALTIGLWAVGRPSCTGGVDALRQLCRRLLITHLIVVGDNDAPKARPSGGFWTPGLDGARRLMAEIGRPCKLVLPPAKDLRAWLKAGATRVDFDLLCRNQAWRIYGR
jgi:hypothetical protein